MQCPVAAAFSISASAAAGAMILLQVSVVARDRKGRDEIEPSL